MIKRQHRRNFRGIRVPPLFEERVQYPTFCVIFTTNYFYFIFSLIFNVSYSCKCSKSSANENGLDFINLLAAGASPQTPLGEPPLYPRLSSRHLYGSHLWRWLLGAFGVSTSYPHFFIQSYAPGRKAILASTNH